MIKNELQLKKIIKNILTESLDYKIDDVIDGYSTDIETAIENKKQNPEGYSEDNITIAIRKNNVLLEIIFRLVSIKSEEFKSFYRNSKMIQTNEDEFYKQQEKHRKQDLDKIKQFLKSFIDGIRNVKNADGFIEALNSLKSQLKNYIPKWTILQYLFLNISDENSSFDDLIDDASTNKNLWESAENAEGKKITVIQYLKSDQNVITNEKIKGIINQNKLDNNDKKKILSNNVSSPSFMRGIKRGEWNWLSDTIDDTAKFFFPNLSSITDEIENWFDDIGRALGKDPDSNENWFFDYIKDNPEIKKYLNKVKNGNNITQSEMEDLLNKLEEDRGNDSEEN